MNYREEIMGGLRVVKKSLSKIAESGNINSCSIKPEPETGGKYDVYTLRRPTGVDINGRVFPGVTTIELGHPCGILKLSNDEEELFLVTAQAVRSMKTTSLTREDLE